MITIYGSPKTSSGRCFWCLEETGVKYDAKSIDFRANEHKSSEYLKLNANGKVPTLTDEKFTIWESVAINFYLAESYKPELLGKTVQDRGRVHQWSLWAMTELQPPIIEIFIQMVFVPEDKKDLKLIEKSKDKLPNLLTILNTSLEGHTNLVGEGFSLADLNVASVVSICENIEYDIGDFPHIENWLKVIAKRSAFQNYMKRCQ